jgi:glutathione peroxidase
MLTLRQRLLKWVYPLFVSGKKLITDQQILHNEKAVSPPVPFYGLSVELNDGKELSLGDVRGKKVLIVNTASNCGYTGQYTELQKLHEQSKDLVIIGFPANDFKEQEKGSDEAIAAFCRANFGVSFLLAKKSRVIRGPGQNKVFQWLTSKELNGWNDQPPAWNFSKYLIDEEGRLMHYFAPAISPLGRQMSGVL